LKQAHSIFITHFFCNLIAFLFYLSLHLMKIAIRIFTIYMFALSLAPCGDGGNGIVEITKHFFGIEHHHVSDHDQHSKGCGDDSCTPFCVCSCCSIALDVPTKLPFLVKYLPPTPTNQPSLYSDFIPSLFIHSIWHPPIFS